MNEDKRAGRFGPMGKISKPRVELEWPALIAINM